MFAVNAYEMLQNGNYFTLSYNNLPDLYNTKPPLTNWLQIIAIKLVGYNELAIRLPSAIAAFLTVLFSFKFMVRYFNYSWAWCVALNLLTAQGFTSLHAARGGEADAILTLFLLLTNLNFINYLITEKRTYIYFFFLFLTLAFCTKLFASLLFLPGYIIILTYYKKWRQLLKKHHLYTGLVLFMVISTMLLLLREQYSPGYLATIFCNDAGRLFAVTTGYEKALLYYIRNFFDTRLTYAFMLVLIGSIFIMGRTENEIQSKVLKSAVVLGGIYLLIITCSVTKLAWYDLPLYPLFAILAAYPLILLLNLFIEQKKYNSNLMKLSFIILIFSYPYYYAFTNSQCNSITDANRRLEANQIYLFNAINNNIDVNGLKVFYKCYDAPLLFYKYRLKERNATIHLTKDITNFNNGDKVLIAKKELMVQLSAKFTLTTINKYQYATVYQLSSK